MKNVVLMYYRFWYVFVDLSCFEIFFVLNIFYSFLDPYISYNQIMMIEPTTLQWPYPIASTKSNETNDAPVNTDKLRWTRSTNIEIVCVSGFEFWVQLNKLVQLNLCKTPNIIDVFELWSAHFWVKLQWILFLEVSAYA